MVEYLDKKLIDLDDGLGLVDDMVLPWMGVGCTPLEGVGARSRLDIGWSRRRRLNKREDRCAGRTSPGLERQR